MVYNFEKIFNADEWQERCKELLALKVTGACFYTDGGFKDKRPKPNASWGIHSYFYNDGKPTRTSRYKIHFPTIEGYVDTPKQKTDMVNSVKVFNMSGLISGDDVTNNVAEIQAVIAVIELVLNTDLKTFLKNLRIFSDSEYVLKNMFLYLKQWANNGWRRTNGAPVSNLEYWKHLNMLLNQLDEYEIDVSFQHRRGHVDFGNIIVDKSCTLAIDNRIEINNFCDEEWYFTTDVDIPKVMLEQSYVHFPGLNSDYDHLIFMWSALDPKIEPSQLGCRLPDVSLCVLEMKDKKFLKNMKQVHRECLKLEDEISPVPMVVDFKSFFANTFDYFLKNDEVRKLPRLVEIDGVTICDPTNDKPVLNVISPARNSFKALDDYVHGVNILKRLEDEDSKLVRKTDITDVLYESIEKKGKAKLEFRLKMEEFVETPVEHWVEGELKTTPAILTLGLDLPRRRILYNLAGLNPKIHVVTWELSDFSFRHGVLVECDEGRGFWFSPYSNLNILH